MTNTLFAAIILVLILLLPVSYYVGNNSNERFRVERDTILIPYGIPPVFIEGATKYKIQKINDTIRLIDTVEPEYQLIARYNSIIDSLKSVNVGIISVFDTINTVTNDTINVRHDVISEDWHLSMRFSERNAMLPRDVVYMAEKRKWYEEPWFVGSVSFVGGFLISQSLKDSK